MATFWMVAYQREAYICTAIMITCGVLTYYHTTEILHRFYWRETDNDAMEFSEMSSSTSQKVKSGISSPMLTETLLESQRSPIGGMKDIPVESSVDGKEEDLFEGYVAVKREGASFLAMGSSGGGWERYYCVLSDRHLWWYRDKRAFDMEPDHPAKSRPLDLEYYTPVPAHTTGGSARQLRIKLRSKTSNDIKEWKLQLDTQEEYNQWMEHLSKACA